MRLAWVTGEFLVHRLHVSAEIPAATWSAMPFVSVTRTPEELSVVAPSDVPIASERREGPFVAVRVAGTLPFDLVGVIVRIGEPLKAAGIPIFVVSTFDTDYVLVALGHRERAERAWRDAGFEISAVG